MIVTHRHIPLPPIVLLLFRMECTGNTARKCRTGKTQDWNYMDWFCMFDAPRLTTAAYTVRRVDAVNLKFTSSAPARLSIIRLTFVVGGLLRRCIGLLINRIINYSNTWSAVPESDDGPMYDRIILSTWLLGESVYTHGTHSLQSLLGPVALSDANSCSLHLIGFQYCGLRS